MKNFFKYKSLNLLLTSIVLLIALYLVNFILIKFSLESDGVFIKIFIALSVAGVLISLLSIVLTNSKKIFRLYNAKNIEKITQTIKGTEKKVIKSKIAKDLISSIKKYPLRIAIIIMISIIILT